jgi:DNA-binding NtrC family response regulator
MLARYFAAKHGKRVTRKLSRLSPEAVLDAPAASEAIGGYHQTVKEEKKRAILAALGRPGGNYTEAAKVLGVHPNYLHRLVRNLDVKEELQKPTGR